MKEPGLQIFARQRYRGLYSLLKATEIPENFATHTLNVDLSSSSQIGPDKGYSRFGNQRNVGNNSKRLFTYERGNGYESLVLQRDDGVNSYLEVLIPGDTRTSQDGDWLTLLNNWTTGKIISFTPFNDTGVDNLLFVNGVENFSKWNGAICILSSAALAGATTLNVSKATDDPKANATDGFTASGSLVVMSDAGTRTVVTYTGKTNTSFTGCANVPAMSNAAGIAQLPDTTTHSGLPKFRTIITAQGRLWGTNVIGEETVLKASKVSDFTDFTSAYIDPADPIVEDFPEGGKNVGLASIDNWIIILKENKILGFQLQYPSSTSRVAVRKSISNIGISSVKAIDRMGNDYIYMSKSGQLRRISRLQSEDLFQTEDLNLSIRPSVESLDYSDCSLRYWPKKRMILIAAKSNSSIDNNDKVIKVEISEENQQAVINYSIKDWSIGDSSVYNDDLYFGGSVASRVYKAFDGYSADGASMRFEYTTKAEHFDTEFEQKQVLYLIVKGRVGDGTKLQVQVFFDEAGKTAIYSFELSYENTKYITKGVTNPIGINALGTEPLGGTIEDQDELNPFYVVFAIPQKAYPYTVQAHFYSDGKDQRLIIDSHAWVVGLQSIRLNPLKGLKDAENNNAIS